MGLWTGSGPSCAASGIKHVSCWTPLTHLFCGACRQMDCGFLPLFRDLRPLSEITVLLHPDIIACVISFRVWPWFTALTIYWFGGCGWQEDWWSAVEWSTLFANDKYCCLEPGAGHHDSSRLMSPPALINSQQNSWKRGPDRKMVDATGKRKWDRKREKWCL